MRRIAHVLLLLSFVACSGGGSADDADGDAPDAEAADDLGDAPETADSVEDGTTTIDVDPPAPIALPVLLPCADGWREVPDEGTGVVVCDPWPEGGPATCAADEAQFPGEAGCARLGPACPAGNFAEDLPADRDVLYVLAGAPAGGDGSAATPFSDLAEALAASESNDVIAVSKGSHEACVTVDSYREIVGACVAETIVRCSEPAEAEGTIGVRGPGVTIRSLTLGGARPGLDSMRGGRATLENVLVSEATAVGITIGDGSSVAGHDVIVRGTRPDAADRYGTGIQVTDGGMVDLTRALIEANVSAGVRAARSGTRVFLADSVIRGTLPEADGDNGHAIDGGASPRVVLTRVVMEGNHMTGVLAHDAGTTFTLDDCVIRDTLPRAANDTQGVGVNVHLDAVVDMERTLVEQSREIGVIVLQGGEVRLQDVVVRDTLPRARDDLSGRGVNVQTGSRIDATRLLVARSREVGLFLSRTTGRLEDLTVADTLPQAYDDDGGRGAQVSDGSVIEMVRAALLRNVEMGLMAAGEGTELTITDLEVRDTLCDPTTGHFGHGLETTFGAVVDIERAAFADNHEVTVLVGGGGARLTMRHLSVERTLPADCATTTCPDGSAGMGVVAIGGGRIDVTRFLVTENALCGVTLAHGSDSTGTEFTVPGVVDLHDGIVSRNPIGANVQDTDYDVSRLNDGVRYVENETNLDTTALPVPSAGDE